MNWQDERGYPGTHGEDGQFDGGDTASIIGNLIALGSPDIAPTSLRLMRSTLIRPGGMVRHPDQSKWYGQTDRFSRDQLNPILCSYVGEPVTKEVRILFRWHEVHWFLYAWNWRKNGVMDTPMKTPDITGPEVWALWIRIFGPLLGRLLLPILDLETLVGSIIWRWFKPKTSRLCRNHMLVCITGMKKYPTVTMRLANRLNDWDDLIERHRAHCEAVREYPTAPLFRKALEK